MDAPVALVVNGVRQGEIFAKITAGGDFLLSVADLEARRVRGLEGERVRLGSAGEFLRLTTVPGARTAFDERNLVLSVTLPARFFEGREFNLGSQPNPDALRTRDTSAFLNYRLGQYRAKGAASAWSLNTESALRVWEILLRNESAHFRSDGSTRSIRMQSQAIFDDRDNARRLTVGDFTAASGVLGAMLPLGGVAFAKDYRLTPYLVYQPTASYSGAVTQPSEVEVSVGGLPVFRQRLAPGPFSLQNLSYYGGRRNVSVVVRDALGREQTVDFPYYFTDQALAPGLHDYGYYAGWLRRGIGIDSNDYRTLAAAFIHRYGVSDRLTLGLRGEASSGRFNAGPLATLRFERLGMLNAAVSASHEQERGRSDWAGQLAYEFQSGGFNARFGARRYGDDYVLANPLAGLGLVRHDANAGVGYGNSRLGTIDLDFTRIAPRDAAAQRTVGATYSRSLFGRMSLFGTWRRRLEGDAGNEFFVGLFYSPGPDQTVSILHTEQASSSTSVAQLGRSVGPGEGLGYRISLESSRGEGPDTWRAAPFVEYASRFGTVSAGLRNEYAGSERLSSTRSLALQGGLTWVGGSFHTSRYIHDSFGLVALSPPLPGIRVYQNNQLIGRTDARGELAIQNLGAFLDNQIAIEDKDVPIAYSIDRTSVVISPPFRSGSLVAFRLERVIAVAGRLVLRSAAAMRPLEYHQASVLVGAREIAFPTGTGGEFYLENAAPGTYRGSVKTAAGTCAFEITVPESPLAVVEIKEPIFCELPT